MLLACIDMITFKYKYNGAKFRLSMQGRAKERGISEVQVETRGTKVGEHASQEMKNRERGRSELQVETRRERERQKRWRACFTEDERSRERGKKLESIYSQREIEKSKSMLDGR